MLASLVEEAPRFFTYANGMLLLRAMAMTLALAAAGVVGGSLLGGGLALVRLGRGPRWLVPRCLAIAYVEALRRIPFLVTLMLVVFGFRFLRMNLSVVLVCVVVVVLIAAAYMAEIVRAGIQSVHRNQWDAAASMNLRTGATLRHVVLPQAWRVIVPPTVAYFLGLVKDTALASQLSLLELTYAGKLLRTRGFSGALVYGTLLALYFVLSYPVALLGARLEARLAAARHRRPDEVFRT
jgi:polar amino acid transport system permease protein